MKTQNERTATMLLAQALLHRDSMQALPETPKQIQLLEQAQVEVDRLDGIIRRIRGEQPK